MGVYAFAAVLVLASAIGWYAAQEKAVDIAAHLQSRPVVPTPSSDWWGWSTTERDERYNAWLCWIQWHIMPKFTKRGFKVMKVCVL